MRIYQKNIPHNSSVLNILSYKEKIENEIFVENYKKLIIKDEKKKKRRCLSGNIKNIFIEYHYYHRGV